MTSSLVQLEITISGMEDEDISKPKQIPSEEAMKHGYTSGFYKQISENLFLSKQIRHTQVAPWRHVVFPVFAW